jgi:phage repressor protein C with HTH and peptisase S24 domain
VFVIRRVVGESMSPTLRPGCYVVAIRTWPIGGRLVRPGQIIIAEHDGLEKIKRVVRKEGRSVFLLGDNLEASKDSRQFGWLDIRHVRALVLYPWKLKW